MLLQIKLIGEKNLWNKYSLTEDQKQEQKKVLYFKKKKSENRSILANF